MRSLVPLIAILGLAPAARADEPPQDVRAWTDWDAVLSFAAQIQDRSVYHVDDAEELDDLVDELQAALGPSLSLYIEAVDHGPGPIQLRAAYYIGMSQIALMTRARASLATPDLRDALEPFLEPHAQIACLLFAAIDEQSEIDPSLAPDEPNRFMVRSARAQLASLRSTRRHGDCSVRSHEGSTTYALVDAGRAP
jgi:hypothetical protein